MAYGQDVEETKEWDRFWDSGRVETRNTDAEVFLAVFAVEESGAGDDGVLIVDHCLNHFSCSCTGSIPGAGAEQFGECCAAYHCVGYHLVHGLLVEKGLAGDAAESCEATHRNHGRVAMAADNMFPQTDSHH